MNYAELNSHAAMYIDLPTKFLHLWTTIDGELFRIV